MPTGSTSSSSHLRHAGSPLLKLCTVTEKANLRSLNKFLFIYRKINMEFSNKCECYGAIAWAILNWHLESVSVHQVVINDDPGVRPQKQMGIQYTCITLWNCKFCIWSLYINFCKICAQISVLLHTACVTLDKLFNFSGPHGNNGQMLFCRLSKNVNHLAQSLTHGTLLV